MPALSILHGLVRAVLPCDWIILLQVVLCVIASQGSLCEGVKHVVQGMNFIAGCLLLFMDEEDTFWCLAIIVEELLPGYYSMAMVEPQVPSPPLPPSVLVLAASHSVGTHHTLAGYLAHSGCIAGWNKMLDKQSPTELKLMSTPFPL